MTLTLIVPGLGARSADAIARSSALQRFARYARAPETAADGIEAAILAALGIPAHTPPAPLCAAGAGANVDDDYVLAASPVTLVAGHDDVLLAARVQQLERPEVATLIDRLNRHFDEDGLRFFAPRPSSWYVRTARTPDLATTPLDVALGQSIRSHLPAGGDGRTWQRWQNEIEMLLHDHPVNLAREAKSLPPLSGLWFWGGGRLSDTPCVADLIVSAGDTDTGDLLRGVARRKGAIVREADEAASGLAPILARMSTRSHGAVALPAQSADEDLERLGADWLEPAIDALERGRIDTLQLVANGHGAAATWRAARPAALGRLAARWRRHRFGIPVASAA